MQLIFPQNIFTNILINCLNEELRQSVKLLPSALVTVELIKSESSVALIPVMDLLKNKDLYVSKSYGISFEASLCNSYFYFKPGQKNVDDLYLQGDISSNEVILSKILFSEVYDTEVSIHLLTEEINSENKNLLISGSKNFESNKFQTGISFSEEIIEIISVPYVNYVFAAKEIEQLKNFINKISGIEENIFNESEKLISNFPYTGNTKEYLSSNIPSLVFKFDEQDVEGINQVLRLPYYHQIVNDIVEVKFV